MATPRSITAIHDIDFLRNIETSGDRVIDLEPLDFIKPLGVVALLATLERLTKQQRAADLTLKLPNSRPVRAYLRSCGVFDAMRDLGSFKGLQPEEVIPEPPPVRTMVRCMHFADDSDIEDLAQNMEERFQTELLGFGSILSACHTIFSELATNVVCHAESLGGYVLAQQDNRRDASVIEIAVADTGIGVRASLQKNANYRTLHSDAEAMELAIKEGVSSLEDNSRGYGLYHVTDDVKKNDSREMTMRSGQGKITLRGDGSITKEDGCVTYSGTIVNVVIPC